MATSRDTPPFGKPRGRIGDLVYKWYGTKLVITRVPRFTKKWSPRQKRWRAKVSRASSYAQEARKNPELSAYYEWLGKKLKIPFRAAAMKDYLTEPKPVYADLGHYTDSRRIVSVVFAGRDKISDVRMVLRDAADALLEEGPATIERDSATYAPSKPPPRDGSITVEITARDRPGHRVSARFVGRPGSKGLLRAVG